MTENEAIELLNSFYEMDEMYAAAQVAIQALEEIQQYRAIGTVEKLEAMKKGTLSAMELVDIWCVLEDLKKYSAIGTIEEFKRAKEMEAVYGQVKWERDIAISQLEEIGVALGQKMEEFKALKEKATPKKLEIEKFCGYDDLMCPNCKSYKIRNPKYCCDCGQALDWQ